MEPARNPMLATRVSPDVARAFRLAADAEGTSVSGALRVAVRRYIEDVARGPIPDADVTAAAEPARA